MKRIATVAVVAVTIAAATAFALAPVPRLTGRVVDEAGILDASQEAQISGSLEAFEKSTTTQIAVLTVPSLEGEAIEQYAMRVAEAWKIGQADKDNGVLLVVAPSDRQVRIEVGYGLEGALTDAESARIIRGDIIPNFKSGDYFAGIAAGVARIQYATQNEYKAEPGGTTFTRAQRVQSTLSSIVMFIIFIVMISTRTGRSMLFFMMLSGMGGRGGRRSGGGFSGGGGSFGGGGASGSW